ncbi:MAG: hypothetical protein AB1499_00725 [Nitrospirota bacterium]
MASLTKQEILAQLKKLGVNTSPEIDAYFEEYEEYSSIREDHSYHSQGYYNGPENQ